ncbi:glycoside hydrolase family 10 protein [Salinactinospora qingdaonensis]|uniref:Family 10 glycosylhydrolase n=1 Tax=Salinactinospora qingdaonensis TaxID=702744 RepID=A0ABP7F1F2_9ACTN
MGWFTRSAGAVVALPLLTSCTAVSAGSHPEPAHNPAPSVAADASRQADGSQRRTTALPRPGATPSGSLPQRLPATCQADPAETAHPKRQLRGVWIATVRNIDWPSEPGLSVATQKDELRAQLDRAKNLGLNAVFFHVRPTADALYESELEPWARYLTGTQGKDPGYDPLSFAIDEAHARGLELHAWFNPYRVGWQDPDLANLTEDHPARRNPDWLITHDSQGWLDPGNPDVRAWVNDVVLDVVERYDIDGVHFDDYFYPYPAQGEKFDDDASFAAHGSGFDSRADWRRHNVNTLLAELHEGINAAKPWVRFGVSPFGIWRNSRSDASGSDTRGLQSYSALYADTRAWIQEGSLDYVVPQLYWYRGFELADYETLVPWWADEVAGTSVDLYIGQAAYKVGDDHWEGDDALTRQLDFNTGYPEVTGDIYFSSKSLGGRAEAAMRHLRAKHYDRPALPPKADGETAGVAAVADLSAQRTSPSEVRLTWTAEESARMFAIYRVTGDAAADPCALADAAHLVDVVGAQGGGEQTYLHTGVEEPADDARYYVTALDAYRTESPPGSGSQVSVG